MSLNWPTTVVLVTIIIVSGALAATHVISADWIERTLTGVLGFLLGTAMGIRIGRNGSSLRPPPEAHAPAPPPPPPPARPPSFPRIPPPR